MKFATSRTLKIIGISLITLLLSSCDNTQVYGSVSVGSSWGGYPGYGGSYGRTSVTVGGRIR